MADNGWRDDDRRRWDDEYRRFTGGLRGRERYGWRDDRYMGRRGDDMRRDYDMRHRDWPGRGDYADYRGDYGPASDYQDYGDWNGEGGSFSSYGGPRFGDNWGDERQAYGRGYRNYGAGNYSSSALGAENYGPRTAGYPPPRPYWGNAPRGERGFWDRASDAMASWVGDREAARRRDMDRRRGFSGRGPRGYIRSDERIREDVSDRLTDDWYLDASNIDVEVANGEVTLSGTVDDREDKHRAEHLIENLSGVRHVQNNLRINDSGRERGMTNQALSTPVGSTGHDTSLTEGQTSAGTSGMGNGGQRTGENFGSTH
jgi:osmotically-inducible protein OsmY